MGDMNYGKCDNCGKEAPLNRVTDRFSFPCNCHSPEHFIIHNLCDDCLQTYHMSPDTECNVEVSVETFNIFLKAHGKYALKYHHEFNYEMLDPKYYIDDATNTPAIKLHCTYETLCYLGKIYSEFMYELELESQDAEVNGD